MLKYNHQLPTKSWPCLLVVCLGTSGAIYLCWKVHWIAAAIVAIPVWILLVDVLINRQKSITWYLLDFMRHLFSFGGTAIIAWYLWRIDWRIGAIVILPVFFLLLNTIGFLTLRMYDVTPEARIAKDALKSIDAFRCTSAEDNSSEIDRPL